VSAEAAGKERQVPIDDETSDPRVIARLSTHFADLARELATPDQGVTDPERLVKVAIAAIPHASHAGLTLLREGRRARTLAATDQVPMSVDDLQYSLAQGPCLDAATSTRLVLVPDLRLERRWPRFAARCVEETPVRSIVGVHLPVGSGDHAALNLYATSPHVFDDEDMAVASMLAPFAGLAVEATIHADDVAHLQTALTSSRQIGTATGILMAHRKITADEAFQALRTASSHLNRKLRDIAAQVELTGELPPLQGETDSHPT
jgi:GAF domain-containing protein